MRRLFLIAAVLAMTSSLARAGAPSAGSCGPTSIPGVPGCWGTPACAYVVASDLGPGAACPFDYCNCGDTYVPLLPTTLSNTTTVGCGSYTIQPTANNCPTAAVVAPSNATGSPAPNSATVSPSSSAPASSLPPLPVGGTVVSGTVGTQVLVETYVPTQISQFTGVTTTITTTIVDSQGSTATVTVGPSGSAWIPFNQLAGAPSLPAPSILPSAPNQVTSLTSNIPPASSHSGQTVVTGNVGSQTVTETFVPVTIPGFASLASTITVTTANAQSSPETMVIGPGGIAWTPLSQAPSGVPDLPPPTALPVNPNLPPVSQPGSTPSITSAQSTAPPTSVSPTVAPQSSVSDAFDVSSHSETTFVIGGVTLAYSKTTIGSLATITSPTTITTPMVETNKDGSKFTISAAVIIVGPGGSWWNGGTGGFGIHGPTCIWPFCPPGGGGDVGGSGSGTDPNDPETPGSNEEPDNPDEEENNSQSQSTPTSSQTPTSAPTSSPSSECTSATVSDCSVLCSVPASATSQSCSTSCYSTFTGCSATGTTITSSASASETASGQPCSPSCSACLVPPPKLRMPRRGLTEREMKTPVNNLSKRTLRTPADYNGDVTRFLLSEYAFAEWLVIGDEQNPKGSTGWGRSLIDKRYDAAVHGLYGCTSVVVVSQSAMWVSHFWEIPSFRAREENWLQPRVQEDIDNFNDQVIGQMQNGGPDIVGLTQFTAPGGQFHSLQKPVWAIVTPRANDGVASTYRYDPEVDEIKGVLGNLFPDAPPVVVDYVPNSNPIDQMTTATGKILFQYDPIEAIITDPNDSCNVFQQAIFRLWVEDRPRWVWQKYWPAQPQQFITDFLNYQPHKHKRDVSACELPSSLPQAAIETSGPNLVFSSEPDPEATYWITLSNEVGSTTEASSKSQTSSSLFLVSTTSGSTTATSTPSTTSAPTATPNCIADGAPWFSPTSFCDCGTSTYPTLSPTSGQTSANCAYTILPASAITPVSTAAAPTNIPGLGGLPGCAAVIYGDGQACPYANYCNCGGTAAPFLTTTISGTSTTNCNYTIQPTANSCPPPTTTIPPPPSSTASTPPPKPPAPTVGTIVCNPKSETSGCKTSDVHAGSVKAIADYMGEQFSTSTFTPSTGNFTRTYRDGGAGGKGVTYMMSIGWIPACRTYASQRADRPIDPAVQFDWEGLLKDTYYNCTGNAGLGGYVDVGCLRYGFFPNKVDGVFGASGPANPSLFWNKMHYC